MRHAGVALALALALWAPQAAAQLTEYGQVDSQFFALKAGPQGGTPNILSLVPSFVNTICANSAGCFSAYAVNPSGNLAGTATLPNGQDEDDIVGLQTYLNNAIANPALQGKVVIPPATRASGYYDICAASLIVPNNIFNSKITIDGSQAKIRVLPGCSGTGFVNTSGTATTLMTMFFVPFPKGSSGFHTQDHDQLFIKGLFLDGWGIAQVNVWNDASIVNYEDITLRNVAGGAGNANTNFYGQGGGDVSFTGHNSMINTNDPGHVLYGSGTYPAYNFYNKPNPEGMHDSFISHISAINAAIANFDDEECSGMFYYDMQGYGNNANDNLFGRPLYNFKLTDACTVLRDSYAGGATQAGVYVTHTAVQNQILEILGGMEINAVPYGVLADYGAQYMIKDYSFQNYSTACVGQYDSGGTIQTTAGNWFASQTQIGGNSNCSVATSNAANATGPLTVNGPLVVDGAIMSNGIVVSGTCPTLAFTNGATLSAAYQTSCATGSGSGTLTSATLQLPNGATSGCVLPTPGYRFNIVITPGVTTLTVADACGSTADVQGSSFALGGNRVVSAIVNGAGTAWVVGD